MVAAYDGLPKAVTAFRSIHLMSTDTILLLGEKPSRWR